MYPSIHYLSPFLVCLLASMLLSLSSSLSLSLSPTLSYQHTCQTKNNIKNFLNEMISYLPLYKPHLLFHPVAINTIHLTTPLLLNEHIFFYFKDFLNMIVIRIFILFFSFKSPFLIWSFITSATFTSSAYFYHNHYHHLKPKFIHTHISFSKFFSFIFSELAAFLASHPQHIFSSFA